MGVGQEGFPGGTGAPGNILKINRQTGGFS
jgi:hypothetical protein